MNKKVFICSDESVNSYGFRVLTSGIQLKNFKSNPVGFFNHNTGDSFWSTDPTYRGPVIRWEDITIDGKELKGSPVFDVNDPIGKALSDKVENDFIRAASIGFRIIETSNDPALMEKGQTRPTITKCELMEISVVDIPANKNSLCLYDTEGKKIGLDDNALTTTLSAALKNENSLPKTNNMKLKLLAAWTFLSAALGFEAGKDHEVETTPEKLAELNSKLSKLSDLESQVTTLTAEKKSAEDSAVDFQSKLGAANAQVTTLTAEKKVAEDSAADLQTKLTDAEAKVSDLMTPAGRLKHPVKTGNDPEMPKAENPDDETLTDVDKEARAYAAQYGNFKKEHA